MTQVLAAFGPHDMFGAIGEGAISHELVRDGEPKTLCGKVATHGIKGADLPRCASCVRVSDDMEAKLTAGAQSDTMGSPTIERDAMPKSDAVLTDGDDVEVQISANTERVVTLRKEGNADSAAALATETEELISTKIKGRGAAAKKASLRRALNAANRIPLPSTDVATGETSDIDSIPDAQSLISESVAKMRDSATQMLATGSSARAVAEIYFKLRLAARNRAGLPDLTATSKGYRDIIAEINAQSMADVPVDDVDKRSALDSVRKGVNYQLSTILVDWLRALDNSDHEIVAEHFPMLELPEEGSLSEAVYAAYEGRGLSLPRKSEREIKAERAREKALEAAKVAEGAGSEADAPGDSTKVIAERVTKRVDSAQSLIGLAVSGADKLSGKERADAKQRLTDLATTLIADAAKL
jgi:hypothetical protein